MDSSYQQPIYEMGENPKRTITELGDNPKRDITTYS
jgi:hypothetical protein